MAARGREEGEAPIRKPSHYRPESQGAVGVIRQYVYVAVRVYLWYIEHLLLWSAVWPRLQSNMVEWVCRCVWGQL